MKAQIVAELVKYRDRMLPFMPGRRAADKERAFFAIFSTMMGATALGQASFLLRRGEPGACEHYVIFFCAAFDHPWAA